MATAPDDPAAFRASSPGPGISPSPALGACPELTRCLSSASSLSHGSATTDASHARESLGSDVSATSRQSSGSYAPPRRSDISTSSRDSTARYSTMSFDRPAAKRRGYMRPTGTDFAASAKQRESVLNLGSIAHLQYYFARTGVLDGKGGQLARKRQLKAQTLDFSQLDSSSFLSPKFPTTSDTDSSYASMGSSPDLGGHGFTSGGGLVESPILEQHPGTEEEAWFMDEFDEPDPNMLPPTASTYNHREKPLPRPPSIQELKQELKNALDAASKALREAKTASEPSDYLATPTIEIPDAPAPPASPGWYEIQGMHILDVMTLAIRAAKVYYTTHEHPDRLDAIKPEKEVRAELLAVMDVLKRMATRNFAGGMRDDEVQAMERWTDGLYGMLKTEEEMEAADKRERASWIWLKDTDWTDPSRSIEREYAFLLSMLEGSETPEGLEDGTLPPWTRIDCTKPLDAKELPTPFLKHMQNGIRLVQLHNCAVRKSQRRFGAIPTFHADTQKPYRSADNLRYWAKAAELRWEVVLKVDALAIVCNSSPGAWVDFEAALLKWCRKVREEISREVMD